MLCALLLPYLLQEQLYLPLLPSVLESLTFSVGSLTSMFKGCFYQSVRHRALLCPTAIDDTGPQLASRHGVVRRQVHESGKAYHRMLQGMLSESLRPCN